MSVCTEGTTGLVYKVSSGSIYVIVILVKGERALVSPSKEFWNPFLSLSNAGVTSAWILSLVFSRQIARMLSVTSSTDLPKSDIIQPRLKTSTLKDWQNYSCITYGNIIASLARLFRTADPNLLVSSELTYVKGQGLKLSSLQYITLRSIVRPSVLIELQSSILEYILAIYQTTRLTYFLLPSSLLIIPYSRLLRCPRSLLIKDIIQEQVQS